MHALKIRKIGNSLGIVLPKEALSRLKVAEGGTVHMTDSKEGAFRLTALNEKFPEQMKEAERIMREDRDILHELAGR
jgi:putative addiction module antidote